MSISWTYIKRGGTIGAPGYYETDDNGRVQTVKLAGTINDWVHLRYIDNVNGSAANDLLSLVTPADKNFGVISLNGGDDTVELASAATYFLKLTSVEHVTGVAGATLQLTGPAAFETDGSVSILANLRNSAVQTVTFSDIVEDITVNLGKGSDTVIFSSPVSFGIDEAGRLLAIRDGHTLTFDGYAETNTSLTIVADGDSYTYAALLASDLIDTAGPAVSIDAIATDSGATGSIADGGLTKDTTLELSGSVADDSGVASVHVFDGATDLGAATLDGLGGWSFTTAALSEASHSLKAVATDTLGNSSDSAVVSATIDTTAPTIPVATVTLVTAPGGPDYFELWFSEAVSSFDLSINNGHSLGSPIEGGAILALPDTGGYLIRLAGDNTVATDDVITLIGVTDLAGNALVSPEITVTSIV